MHRIAITAGFLRQRAAEPRLADTARSGDQQIAMLGNPAAGGQLLEQRLVEPSGGTIVDVLDRRLAVAQLRIAQPAFEPLRAAMRRLAIEQQRQPFGRREIPGSVQRLQFNKGLGHAVEPQGSQLVDGWMGEHWVFSRKWKWRGPRMFACTIAGPSVAEAGRRRSWLVFR